MKRIGIVSVSAHSAHSFWRCMGPWSYLEKNSSSIQVDLLAGEPNPEQSISWATLSKYDLIFFHGPMSQDHLTILKVAKNLHIPTWVDIDDNVFSVPHWSPAMVTYHRQDVQTIVAQFIACCDIVSTTTAALYDKLKPLNKNTIIIPNAYRTDLFNPSLAPRNYDNQNQTYFWRGTKTHDGDLNSVWSAFPKLKGKLTLMGDPSWLLLQEMDPTKFQVIGMQDPMVYFHQLRKIKPKVVLVPLADCEFNKAKSNIAWIEALHAGAVTVAPDFPEWQRPGVMTYKANDPDSFLNTATEAMEMDTDFFSETISHAHKHMIELYGIEPINSARTNILQDVLNGEFEPSHADPCDPLQAIYALSKMRNLVMKEISASQLSGAV